MCHHPCHTLTLQVLAAIVEAGRAAGLDAAHSTARSVLLQQRVVVPGPAFSSFLAATQVSWEPEQCVGATRVSRDTKVQGVCGQSSNKALHG